MIYLRIIQFKRQDETIINSWSDWKIIKRE